MKKPYVVPDTSRRDLLIGLGIGALVLGVILFAFLNMGSGLVGSNLTGTIIAKRFTPAPEEQVTVGKKGVHVRKIDGEYLLEVQAGKTVYNVPVEKRIYEVKKVGESFTFPRPRN